MHATRQSADVHTDRAKLLTAATQVAGTHGTVRLDDFVIPYRPDKASFLVTNNHGFTDLDLAVKTETEERVVCTHHQPACNIMFKSNITLVGPKSSPAVQFCIQLYVLCEHPCVAFFTHQLLHIMLAFTCSFTNKDTKRGGCVCCCLVQDLR